MKFLYIGDFHLCDNPPSSRIDDYHKTLINKIREIKAIARDNQCTAILEGGDLLNTPRISEEMLSTYISEFNDSNINSLIIDAINGNVDYEELAFNLRYSAPLIGVVGNHELFGETMKSFNKTSLCFLESIGLINLVTKEKPIIFKDSSGFTVAITGSNYSHEIDKEADRKDYIIDKKLGDFHIHIVHGMMLDKENKLYANQTLAKDIIEKTKADITLCGHYHDGFKTVRKDGKYICNSGAVVRQTMRKVNLTRKPKVLLIEITKEKGVRVESIQLKCVESADKVFNLEEKEKTTKFSQKLEEIKAKVQEYNIEKGNNIVDIVKNIADNKNLDEDSKNEIVNLLSDKMKDMKHEVKEVPKYTIQKLILENFQSHEYSEFEFSDGLNVFTGESGSGKTSIIRALNWIYENSAKNARRYIRSDKEFCKATIVLSNGYEISRIVEKSPTKGFNGYEIYYPDTQERKKTNTKELPVIQELLGFSKLIVDNSKTSKDIPINFLKQGSPWFFVGDANTAPERAKIIGSIYGTQYVDSLSKDLEQELRKNNAFVKESEQICKDFEEQINCINFIENMKHDLDRSDELIQKVQIAIERKNKISSLVTQYEQLNSKINALNHFLDESKNVEENFDKINDKINEKLERKSKVLILLKKYQELYQSFSKMQNFIKEIKDIDLDNKLSKIDNLIKIIEKKSDILLKVRRGKELSEELEFNKKKNTLLNQFVKDTESLNGNVEIIDKIIDLIKKKDYITKQTIVAIDGNKKIKALTFIVEQINQIEKKKDIISKLEESIKHSQSIKDLQLKGRNEQIKKANINNEINKLNESVQLKKDEYAYLLKEAGHCPVCANKIEIESIPDIIKANFTE